MYVHINFSNKKYLLSCSMKVQQYLKIQILQTALSYTTLDIDHKLKKEANLSIKMDMNTVSFKEIMNLF